MSVTFSMEQAPVMRHRPYPDDEPDYWQVDPVEPFVEINLANSNARAMLAELVPWHDYEDLCGEWDQEELKRIRVQLIKLLNTKAKGQLVAPDEQLAPNYFICGRDAEYVDRRLMQFLQLVSVAMEHEFNITFG